MKKIMLITAMAAMLLTMAMPINAQTRKEKKAAQKEQWEARQQFIRDSTARANANKLGSMDADNALGREVQIPCIEASYDDEEYFRELGIGTSDKNNKQAARQNAVNQAKAMIKARLGEYIQGVTKDYFNSYSVSASDDVQHKIETKMNGVVDYMLNHADKECEKALWTDKGTFEFYYVVRIPKEDMKKQMMDAVKEAKMEIDFNEHQMQKFMDDNMDKMLKERRQAGY